MKNLLILILALFTLYSCGVDSNTEKANEWIATHEKPIFVKVQTMNGFSLNYRYSLQSADNEFYYTGGIAVTLPDTIKESVSKPVIYDTIIVDMDNERIKKIRTQLNNIKIYSDEKVR